MQKEPIYKLLKFYDFFETKEPDQFSSPDGMSINVGEVVVVWRFGKIGLVTDSLERLENFLNCFSILLPSSNLERKFYKIFQEIPEEKPDSSFQALEFHEAFWDCECEKDFVHRKDTLLVCPKCNAHQEDQPDSLAHEVADHI
ncbi:hypothetical protein AB3N59_20440 (plasmid) [Leptospira sp. WS92.C1]